MSNIFKRLSFLLLVLGNCLFSFYVLGELDKMRDYYVPCENGLTEDNIVYNSDNTDEELKQNDNVNFINNNINKLAILDIPGISLRRYLYDVSSPLNNVDKNIEILDNSQMPDVSGGNLILAAHSGNSVIAHFHNLNNIDIGDDILLYYNNIIYTYVVDKKYTVPKTGEVAIKRDRTKTTITLITCYGNSEQLIVIGYLKR